ncbi:hypothetical protein DSO57_1007958 [Entomophthora muscae]|uniref:Uncharacterized protein n=1 Tax=Entomophthora muscae TaxID=34485 RepID=A0ACC2SW83_9FUNG|nr:hypothetical protein DSO57_1007958 [Entomophthora muscae]
MKFISLILLSVVSGRQESSDNIFLFGENDILHPGTAIKKIFSTLTPTAVPLIAKTFSFVPPVEKNPPVKVEAASIDEVKDNFINSYMPFCPAEKIAGKDCICKETYPHVKYIEDKDTGTLVVVAVNKKYNQIVVSYRITANLQNWLDNLNLQLVDVSEMPRGVRIHRGIYSNFVTSYVRTQDAVIELLDNKKYQNHTLFVTGYSLGAGLAQVSTPSWYNLLKNRNDTRTMKVISYANPRVGNGAFAKYMDSLNISITRYTTGTDIVPHVPGRKLGYVHAGAEVYGTNSKIGYFMRDCGQEFDEAPECILSAFGKRSPVDHAYPFGKFIPLPPYC